MAQDHQKTHKTKPTCIGRVHKCCHKSGSTGSNTLTENESDSAICESSSSSDDSTSEDKTKRLLCSENSCSDEYADPVDAIHGYLNTSVGNFVFESHPKGVNGEMDDSPTAAFSPEMSANEELMSSPQLHTQLQQFHERLFQDTPLEKKKLVHNGGHKILQLDDSEPTYSSPFDAINVGHNGPLKVTSEMPKRNITMSPTSWQAHLAAGKKSPPPPPLPSREEKYTNSCKAQRFPRQASGESDIGTSERNTSTSPVSIPPSSSEKREQLLRKSKASTLKNREIVSPTHATTGGEKMQAPLSIAERLRLLRQRAQSDAMSADDSRTHPHTLLPLLLPEQESVEPTSQKTSSHPLNGERKVAPADFELKKKMKSWLERTKSDTSREKVTSSSKTTTHGIHGCPQVLPLSVKGNY